MTAEESGGQESDVYAWLGVEKEGGPTSVLVNIEGWRGATLLEILQSKSLETDSMATDDTSIPGGKAYRYESTGRSGEPSSSVITLLCSLQFMAA